VVTREGVDDLLQPVLAQRPPEAPRRRPWRLSSQAYVAILGGPLAVAAIGLVNARRLRLRTSMQATIVTVSLAAEAALIVLAHAADLGRQARVASAVAGVVVYGVAYLIQRSADRVYAFHADADEPYASLLGPGAAAVVTARIIELLVWFPT
jgi:hypothetical protein